MNAIAGILPATAREVYVDPFARAVLVDPYTVPIIHTEQGRDRFPNVGVRHGRNHFDIGNEVFKSGMHLVDGFGNYYATATVKGIDAAKPTLTRDDHEPNDVSVNGLQDAETFVRCWAASRYLRKKHLLTEWLMYAAIPERLPDPTASDLSAVDQQAFKEIIHREFLTPTSVSYAGAAALDLINDVDFGVSYRAMLSPYRLFDAPHFSGNGLMDAIGSAIEALQRRRPPNYKTMKMVAPLNAENEKDQLFYYQYCLPALIGENLAKVHNGGVSLHYPHGGNWSLAGEIIDLDSAMGKGIFKHTKMPLDDPITQSDTMRDLFVSLTAAEKYIDFGKGRSLAMFVHSYICSRRRVTEAEGAVLAALTPHINYRYNRSEFDENDDEVCTDKTPSDTDIKDAENFVSAQFKDLEPRLRVRMAGMLAVAQAA